LHCDGVSATLLSAGVFPSLIKPIDSICNFEGGNLHFTFNIQRVTFAHELL